MGYYTYYTITAEFYPQNAALQANYCESIRSELEEISGYSFDGRLEEGGSLYSCDSIKWYLCDEDMHELSVLYPGVLFTVFGEGEETGDLWYAYHLNGKMQKDPARVEFDGFQLQKLEPWNKDGGK